MSKKVPITDETCDFIICSNALDHIPDIGHGIDELYRITKKEGIAFIHVHLRNKRQLNKAHIHSLNLKKTLRLTGKQFDTIKAFEDTDWVNGREDRRAAYLTLRKK